MDAGTCPVMVELLSAPSPSGYSESERASETEREVCGWKTQNEMSFDNKRVSFERQQPKIKNKKISMNETNKTRALVFLVGFFCLQNCMKSSHDVRHWPVKASGSSSSTSPNRVFPQRGAKLQCALENKNKNAINSKKKKKQTIKNNIRRYFR